MLMKQMYIPLSLTVLFNQPFLRRQLKQRLLLHAFAEEFMLCGFGRGHEPNEISKHITQSIQSKEGMNSGPIV